MAVYDADGNVLSAIYDADGSPLNILYDADGVVIFNGGGDVPVDRDKDPYDYYADPDPQKSYVWSYSLQELKAIQNGHFTIGVQTDTHYNNEDLSYGTPLKNMTKQLYFDFICNLGDIPRGYSQDTVEITKTAIETMLNRYESYVEAPVVAVFGNHDNAVMSGSFITKSEMHDYYIGNNNTLTDIVNPTGELYYYKDFHDCRVIVLDTNNYPYVSRSNSDVNINHTVISSDQVSWFANVALNTDKPVIVVSHNALITDVHTDFVEPTEDVAGENYIPYRADQIRSAMLNFIQNGGTIACCLNGHIHLQNDVKVNGINYITFKNGGTFAELLFIDFDNRTIITKAINSTSINDRTFTF